MEQTNTATTSGVSTAALVSETKAPIHYIASLDGVRAIGALLVIVEHVYQNFAVIQLTTPGYFGVRLFFVLSGFLITSILLQSRYAGAQEKCRLHFLRAFYVRRSLRIFPIYYLTLTIMAILSIWVHGLQGYYWWRYLYLTNFHMMIHHTQDVYYGHLWSLAVEEQFYLLWPCIVLFAPKRALGWIICLFIMLAPISRLICAETNLNELWLRKPPSACFDALGFGALLAYMRSPLATTNWKLLQRRLRRFGPWIGAGVCIIALICRSMYGERDRMTLVGLGLGESLVFFALLDRCITKPRWWLAEVLSSRPLVFTGKISYGIYLYHAFTMPLAWATLRASNVNGSEGFGATLDFVLVTVFTVLVASLSWILIEKPLNALKSQFPYSPRPKAIPTISRGTPK